MKKLLLLFCFLGIVSPVFAQHSIARAWNEVLLNSIRRDFARPTVHARNLFHISAAMYDAWAVFSDEASTYLLGNEVNGFNSLFMGYDPASEDINTYRKKAISYAAYRLIEHRFVNSPNYEEIMELANQLLVEELGYDVNFEATNYQSGEPEALGNYIAAQYIAYGLQDGSNEAEDYENKFYEPVNQFLSTELSGNPTITDPNRWQPLAFNIFIDQSGNPFSTNIPEFLSPEWGQVLPFSMTEDDLDIKMRDGIEFPIYHDPGPPPYIDPVNGGPESELYQWNFSLVAIWSGQLDPTLEQEIDISPASLGNYDIANLPVEYADYDQFYNYLEGGAASTGYTSNPVTGEPYSPQVVKLGDYGRILAEFWADGPDSETPPGHWYTILNYVSDHPLLEKKLEGEGAVLDDLEWDVKAYFTLGGAMHDVAISAWGIKGYYDYIRPVSAIRYMADQGQSTDESLPNYNIAGIPLVEGYIELVMEDDPLVGNDNQNLHKIKLWAWRGPDYITNPETDEAGVGWILAEDWWPYQRPTFITPPFAGYISGHSTFSRAAAEVMTRLTGSPYFPGGMGIFDAKQNEFLVFEEGPSEDIELQWASYRDASDECSLSRVWGGIHPPADDLNGRRIGEVIGNEAFDYAKDYFGEVVNTNQILEESEVIIFPNPVKSYTFIQSSRNSIFDVQLFDLSGKLVLQQEGIQGYIQLDMASLSAGSYLLKVQYPQGIVSKLVVKL